MSSSLTIVISLKTLLSPESVGVSQIARFDYKNF